MIKLHQLSFRTGGLQFENLSLDIPSRSYAVLMGKTGAGKTSLLELICGLRPIDSGSIFIDSAEVSTLPPGQRGIGYVPQDAALFPTLPVKEQIAFALKLRKRAPHDVDARTREVAQALRIESLLDRLPHHLSGGERQRVALGRALAMQPEVLLLDEPLSALDDETRHEMILLLKTIHRQTQTTVLHVTHQHSEADSLADLRFKIEGSAIHPIQHSLQTAPGTQR
jgi:ABC-type sugar transport system ATPase subunit